MTTWANLIEYRHRSNSMASACTKRRWRLWELACFPQSTKHICLGNGMWAHPCGGRMSAPICAVRGDAARASLKQHPSAAVSGERVVFARFPCKNDDAEKRIRLVCETEEGAIIFQLNPRCEKRGPRSKGFRADNGCFSSSNALNAEVGERKAVGSIGVESTIFVALSDQKTGRNMVKATLYNAPRFIFQVGRNKKETQCKMQKVSSVVEFWRCSLCRTD